MKRLLLINCLLLAFLSSMLLFPSLSMKGASLGLTTWFQQVVPTLFPTMILSSIMIQTDAFFLVLPLISPLCSKLFSISAAGSCAVVIGWLCGYPMGAKIANELYATKKISEQEAKYLLCFVNQPSPMFLCGFLRYQILNDAIPIWKILFSVYVSAYILSLIARLGQPSLPTAVQPPPTQSTQKLPSLRTVIEQSFHHSCSILLTIGIYMMLFSIAAILVHNLLALPSLLTALLSAILEMTSGISQLALLTLTPQAKAVLSTAFAAFGGCCTALQSASVSREISYSPFYYLGSKLLQATLAGSILHVLL